MTRRIEALCEIKKYVSRIDHHVLYIEESIYMNIGMILTQQSQSIRFIEQNLKFDFKHHDDFEPILLKNNSSVAVIENDSSRANLAKVRPTDPVMNLPSWHIVFGNTTSDTHRFKHNPIPIWLQNSIPEFNLYRISDNQISVFYNNFMGLIHRASNEQMCTVRDFNEIVDPTQKTMNINLGLNFISINCMSVVEA